MTQAYNLAILANAVDSSGKLNVATNSTGTLPVANGGTGQTTYTNGQLLIGNTTGNTLTKATLTAGSGITVTNGAGTITIASSGGAGTVTSVATGNGLQGGTITTSGTLSVACPSANTVGSYAAVMFSCENSSLPVFGSDYSAGAGSNQFYASYIPFEPSQAINGWRLNNQLSGSWKWMGASNGGVHPASYKLFGIACRVS